MSFATTLYDPVFAGERVPLYVLNATLRAPSTQPSTMLLGLDEHGTTSTNVTALIDQIKADVDLSSYRLIADSYSNTQTDGMLALKANQATAYTKLETDSLLTPKFDAANLHGYLTTRPVMSPVVAPFDFVTHTSSGVSKLGYTALLSTISAALNDPPVLTNASSIYNKKHTIVPTLTNSSLFSTANLGSSITNSVVASGATQPIVGTLFNTTIVNPRVSSNWNSIDSFANCCYINGAPKPGSGARSGEIVINSTTGNGEKSLTINDEAFGTLKVFIPGLESA